MPFRSPFPSKSFRPSGSAFRPNTVGAWYRRNLDKQPFLLFGFPFIALMVAGSFVLTPATAIRYERHDRKVKQLTREEELSIGRNKRKVDINEEYYRLAAKDIDNWEQKRVKRFEGEPDGKFG